MSFKEHWLAGGTRKQDQLHLNGKMGYPLEAVTFLELRVSVSHFKGHEALILGVKVPILGMIDEQS